MSARKPSAAPLCRAAAWARANDGPLGYGLTAPAIGALACDLPPNAGWSDAVVWAAERMGVDAWGDALPLAPASPSAYPDAHVYPRTPHH